MRTTVRVANMSGEIYYAPQMVADRGGFLRDEGLELEVLLVDTCDVPAVLDRGDADLALCGMWQPWLYKALKGTDYRVFAQLNQQVPLSLFARVPAEEFDWAALGADGTTLLTSVVACSPWAALEGLLLSKGVDLGAMRTVVGFPPREAHDLVHAGYGDLVEIFTSLDVVPFLRDESLHRVVDWTKDLGPIPWSVYFSHAEWLARQRPLAAAFSRALGRAQRWLAEHEAGEVAELIAPEFPGVSVGDIELVVGEFQDSEQWPEEPDLQREASLRWQSILERVGVLVPGVSYEDLVDPTVVAEAVRG
jgi:NitT/TauT family transport system substrate-binding protein